MDPSRARPLSGLLLSLTLLSALLSLGLSGYVQAAGNVEGVVEVWVGNQIHLRFSNLSAIKVGDTGAVTDDLGQIELAKFRIESIDGFNAVARVLKETPGASLARKRAIIGWTPPRIGSGSPGKSTQPPVTTPAPNSATAASSGSDLPPKSPRRPADKAQAESTRLYQHAVIELRKPTPRWAEAQKELLAAEKAELKAFDLGGGRYRDLALIYRLLGDSYRRAAQPNLTDASSSYRKALDSFAKLSQPAVDDLGVLAETSYWLGWSLERLDPPQPTGALDAYKKASELEKSAIEKGRKKRATLGVYQTVTGLFLCDRLADCSGADAWLAASVETLEAAKKAGEPCDKQLLDALTGRIVAFNKLGDLDAILPVLRRARELDPTNEQLKKLADQLEPKHPTEKKGDKGFQEIDWSKSN